MNICLFTEDELERPLDLHDRRAEHLLKVLHKAEGDSFSAGIIGGPSGLAHITRIVRRAPEESEGKRGRTAGELHFCFEPQGDGKPLFPLFMLIGFPRPIQLRRLLRDMAGLGVQAVYLTGTELGEKSYLRSDLATTEAGLIMLREGTEQAASTHVPQLYKADSLADCLARLAQDVPAAARYALDNVRPSASLCDALQKTPPLAADGSPAPVVAAIGSERGWTDGERELLLRQGYALCGMGRRVLRTESAATVAASLVLAAMKVL